MKFPYSLSIGMRRLYVSLHSFDGAASATGAAAPIEPSDNRAPAGRLENGVLIRVKAGTLVHASVRNSVDRPLTPFGFGARRGMRGDSVIVAPNAVGGGAVPRRRA